MTHLSFTPESPQTEEAGGWAEGRQEGKAPSHKNTCNQSPSGHFCTKEVGDWRSKIYFTKESVVKALKTRDTLVF